MEDNNNIDFDKYKNLLDVYKNNYNDEKKNEILKNNLDILVIAGDANPPAITNMTNIDYVTIMSAGNAQDFGDITGKGSGKSLFRGCSDSHGGLGGF